MILTEPCRGGPADINAQRTFLSSWSNSFLRPVASPLWSASVSSLFFWGPQPPMCEWWCRPPWGSREGALCLNTVCALCRHRAFLGAQTGGKLSRRWRIATPEKEKYVLFVQFLFFITAVATETADTKGLYSRLTPSSAHTYPPSACQRGDNESKGPRVYRHSGIVLKGQASQFPRPPLYTRPNPTGPWSFTRLITRQDGASAR